MKPVEVALALEAREVLLPQRLIEHDRDGIGEVQGADLRAHRDADAVVAVLDEDLLRDAGALLAEHDEVVRAEVGLGVKALGLGRGVPDLWRAGGLRCDLRCSFRRKNARRVRTRAGFCYIVP